MIIESSSLTLQSNHEALENSTAYRRTTDTDVQTLTRIREAETLQLQATGNVTTQSGDVLDISLQSTLERYDRYETFTSQSIASLMDPLVINLSGGLADVDALNTFLFDLNSDGSADEMSLLGHNNGFLTYDKNENGIIDDGSELFGTQSGDGFADLAQYDDDGNGWIDENDSIFPMLKIWQKSALEDSLISLSQAQVGALLLESADSSFTYKKGADTNAQLQESSVVLFENGKVGWVSHVDFAITSTQEQSGQTSTPSLTASTSSVLSASLGKLKQSSSSDLGENLLSSLKNRLKVLHAKLAKTHDESEKSGIIMQILKISMQIAQLGG
ncbi:MULTISPECIES: hypothetical protein [unclassified Sulfurospirillum]|uniref:hypothetical protein n=1 Tax=unclassified Sulfurospirillum TaxID=2618290 RepID=UPI000500DF7B|nr:MULTISPECIES: hypothetical protein [unclassified Sulfurospirillum]KFL34436.1 membrane protein [Sulfurospirillum sp. SCADC]